MMTKVYSLEALLRENIKKVKPYSSARDEYKGTEGIFLDANENAYGSVGGGKYNRYPDPLQKELKIKIAPIKGVSSENIFLGNGSDEPIDLLFRAICNPGKDNVITMPPTYGMYEVSAGINDVRIKEVALSAAYEIEVEKVLAAVDGNTKMIFICSPNNPTGNCVSSESTEKILQAFAGLVVVDEAYIDFAPGRSLVPFIKKYPNLVVLQTFSKAWGMAALRLGMAFASEEIIKVLNKIKAPYNINSLTQEAALKALDNVAEKDKMVKDIIAERELLTKGLQELPFVLKVYPSDANFLLVKATDGKKMYDYLVSHKIITRDRSKITLCENAVRITVGTAEENKQLLQVCKQFKG